MSQQEQEDLWQRIKAAEERALRAEQEAERALRAKQEAEKQSQQTTFLEYLNLCHKYLFRPLVVQQDKTKATKGPVTSAVKKLYPERLRLWEGFVEDQQRRFDTICSMFHPRGETSPKLFDSESFLKRIGELTCEEKYGSEEDLRPHQMQTVETPVKLILRAMRERQGTQGFFNLGDGVVFENHPNTLDPDIEEAQERLEEQRKLSGKPQETLSSIKPDRICVFQNAKGRKQLAYVIEYKPPHKLDVKMLRAGLRPMDVTRDVIEQYKIPTEKQKKWEFYAAQIVARVITQTFDYMIKSGVEYSYISIAKAFIFLWVQEKDPSTAFYHLMVPEETCDDTGDLQTNAFQTAIGQVLCFTLLAFGSRQRRTDWRNYWSDTLPKWPANYEIDIPGTPEPDVEQTRRRASSEFKGKSPEVLRSYNLRSGKTSSGRQTCNEESAVQGSSAHDDDSSSDAANRDNKTPSRRTRRQPAPARRAASGRSSSPRTRSHGRQGHRQRVSLSKQVEPPGARLEEPCNSTNASETHPKRADSPSGQETTENWLESLPTRQFCTQSCLLGLVQGGALDEGCPNITAHRSPDDPQRRHRVDVKTFLGMVQAQLGRTLDRDFGPMGKSGARGMLFKITLASHGYTFVGKGTIDFYLRYLQHEARVYRQLQSLQGEVVPVCLGSVDLIYPYWDFGTAIVHMLLLGWAGEHAEPHNSDSLASEIGRAVNKVRRAGVEHGDVREPNVLWNDERGGVMLIDFERARINTRPPPRPQPAAHIRVQSLRGQSPNRKRKFLPEKTDCLQTERHAQRRQDENGKP